MVLKSDALDAMIDAYRNGSYDGNLIDIIPSMSKYVFSEKQNFRKTMRELMRVPFINVFRLSKLIKKLEEIKQDEGYYINSGFYIDNKKLDGATQFFMDKGYIQSSCDGCDFCENLVKKAVTNLGETPPVFKGIINDLVEGYYF